MQRFERLAAFVFGFSFLFLAFAVAVETIMRKVFNKSLQGVDELGGYVLAAGAGLSFAVALTSRTHIRIDILHDAFPKSLRILLNMLALPAITACAAAAAYMAWLTLIDTIGYNATAQTPWATPLKYPQAAWFAALAVFLIFGLVETARLFALFFTWRFDEIDRRYGPRGAKDELEDELADMKARGITVDDAGQVKP